MCIGVPLQILSVDGIAARATDGETEELIDLSVRNGGNRRARTVTLDNVAKHPRIRLGAVAPLLRNALALRRSTFNEHGSPL